MELILGCKLFSIGGPFFFIYLSSCLSFYNLFQVNEVISTDK